MDTKYIIGEINNIPLVSTKLNASDKFGTFKARWGYNRDNYIVTPGLYAVGNPDTNSQVLVSANYKLSFDALRKELTELNLWILVIDTRGINVWCAAGKGTFGTAKIIFAINKTGLAKIVSHQELIVPQLGAPGVSAHEIKRRTGFKVTYGPVRASDIKAFFNAGKVSSPEMRRVNFTFYDRLVLVPIEIVNSFQYLLMALMIFFVISGFHSTGFCKFIAYEDGLYSSINLVIAYLAGAALGPILLPWLPGRSFAFKGFVIGLIAATFSYFVLLEQQNLIEGISWFLIIPAISSFLTMNFTGASTYTSLSGVMKEMKIAVPIQITAAIIGSGLWIAARFI